MERLKQLRTKAGLTQTDMHNIFGVAQNTYSQWETDKREPDFKTLSRIADYFRVTVDYLLGRSDDPSPADESEIPGLYPVKKKKFPVLGRVACGEPIYAEEEHDTYIKASADIDADFCLIAQGDSMIGAHIEDGDIIFIKKMSVVPNGRIAVVLIGDEATVKYIHYRAETYTLILTPANPAYRTQVYQGEELENIRVLGMAVCLQKSLVKLH